MVMIVATPRPIQPKRARAEPTVVNCYTLFDKFFPSCGLLDYTEGIYHGDATIPLERAQLEQIRYVLDEVQCGRGSRVLDIGCGNGTLLDEVRRRGAIGVGITISPEQTALCRRHGLEVQCINYEDLGDQWNAKFDAVVANGPIEHFVQPRDAIRGQADAIYRRMFEIFHRAIDPDSPVRRLINTTIHFVRRPRPEALLTSPRHHARGSDDWHWSWLARSFGGFYPMLGQFERSAAGRFELLNEIDGTDDYRLTSEEWLRRIRHALRTRLGLTIFLKSLPFAVRRARQTFDMLTCMLATESWNWQFRGPNPPTRLLRQTWKWLPA
jgi:cyclopropane fatty-acyl-phospholipid synthase-like methyltransferase